MKIDIFNHIFPKAFYEKMVKLAPNAKDINKRVRNIPCIVDLDEKEALAFLKRSAYDKIVASQKVRSDHEKLGR
jgi:hypothetical protein